MFIELTKVSGAKFLINKMCIEQVFVRTGKEHDRCYWNSQVIYANREIKDSNFVRETYEEIKNLLED